MNENKDTKENRSKALRFIDRYGFMVLLGVCVVAIGAAAIWSSDLWSPSDTAQLPPTQETAGQLSQLDPTPAPTAEPTAQPSSQAQVPPADESESAQAVQAEPTKAPQPTPAPTPKPSEPKNTATNADAKLAKQMQVPVKGEIIRNFADSELVFSETLQQWMTHSGLDMAAAEGTNVVAALDGEVVSVTQDAMMGTVVTLKHAGDVQTVYASLAPDGVIEAGATVKAGDVIGQVGTSATSEVADGAHVHFEVIKSGTRVDPADYLLSSDE